MQALSLLFCLVAGMASAQTVSLTVNTGAVLHGIDEKIYGQSLEPVYHSVNGGLWGDVVWNRSFEETLTEGAWKVAGGAKAYFEADQEVAHAQSAAASK